MRTDLNHPEVAEVEEEAEAVKEAMTEGAEVLEVEEEEAEVADLRLKEAKRERVDTEEKTTTTSKRPTTTNSIMRDLLLGRSSKLPLILNFHLYQRRKID